MTTPPITHIGFARSNLEVDYWLRLHPCPSCGERDVGSPATDWYQDGTTGHFAGVYHVTCPRCGHQRSIEFFKLPPFDVKPDERMAAGHLGGDEPSQIIGPHEFARELVRCVAEIGPDARVDIPQLEKQRSYPYEWDPLNNGETCSVELAKFLPDGEDRVPDRYFPDHDARAYRAAHPEQFTRRFIERARAHFERVGRDTRAAVIYQDMAKACGWPVLEGLSLPDARTAATELARCLAEIRTDLGTLSLDELGHNNERWMTARRCARYLWHLLPEGQAEIPAAALPTDADRAYQREHPRELSRAYLEQTIAHLDGICTAHDHEYQRRWTEPRYRSKDAPRDPNGRDWQPAPRADRPDHKPVPLPAFSLAALKFHEQWVAHGDGEGRQRMIAVGADARERNLSGRNLSSVVLDKVTLDRANLAYAQLAYAELTQVSAREAQWTHAVLAEATLRRCDFSGSEMTGARLHHSLIEDCNFSGVTLAWGSLIKAEVRRSSFASANLTDARLHDAVFTDCDLRGARLGADEWHVEDAMFIGCDLRDTDWRGRRLIRVHFVDCKLAGARGALGLEDITIVRPDLSPAGDGSQIGEERDVAALLASAAG